MNASGKTRTGVGAGRRSRGEASKAADVPGVGAGRRSRGEASKAADVPLFESVMERVEELFRSRELKAGSKLPAEKELAAKLGVSRHTLREVLKALNLFGIIRSRPGDGTYVQHSVSGIFRKATRLCVLLEETTPFDVLETRIAVEPVLARLAAQKAGRNDIGRMRESLAGMEANLGNLDQYLAHEIAFHSDIASAADNPILRSVMDALADHLLEARRTITQTQTDRHNYRLHGRILEAIEAGDGDGAYGAMLDHLLDNQKHYLGFFERNGSQNQAPGS